MKEKALIVYTGGKEGKVDCYIAAALLRKYGGEGFGNPYPRPRAAMLREQQPDHGHHCRSDETEGDHRA